MFKFKFILYNRAHVSTCARRAKIVRIVLTAPTLHKKRLKFCASTKRCSDVTHFKLTSTPEYPSSASSLVRNSSSSALKTPSWTNFLFLLIWYDMMLLLGGIHFKNCSRRAIKRGLAHCRWGREVASNTGDFPVYNGQCSIQWSMHQVVSIQYIIPDSINKELKSHSCSAE